MPPDYSVVIAVHEGASMLGEALRSISSQRFPPKSVVVVDDGSTEDVRPVVKEARLRVHLIHQDHGGQAKALNTGIATVTTPLVGFLDHDDLWTEDHSEQLLRDWSSDVDAIFGGVVNRFMTDQGDHVDVNMGPSRLLGAAMLSIDFLRQVGPFVEDRRSHTIIEWWSRAMAQGGRVRQIPNIVLIRRVHGANEGLRPSSRTRADLLKRVWEHRARARTTHDAS